MTPALLRARETSPPEGVLRQLRIPFVRRATLVGESRREEVFVIDIGMAGAFVERAEALPVDEKIEIRFAWPGLAPLKVAAFVGLQATMLLWLSLLVASVLPPLRRPERTAGLRETAAAPPRAAR
jgi:hypothetical protein